MIAPSDDTVETALQRFARDCRVPPEYIDDLVQTIWANVLLRLPELHRTRNDADFWQWLFIVVRNRAIDAARRRHTHPTTELRADDAERRPSGADSDPVRQLDLKEECATVNAVMADLKKEVTPINFRILSLSIFEGRKVAEIAVAVGMTTNEVSQRKKRLLKRLRFEIKARAGADFGDDSR